jgi:hypothetical protein
MDLTWWLQYAGGAVLGLLLFQAVRHYFGLGAAYGVTVLAIVLVTTTAEAKRIEHEDVHNRAWCADQGGVAEVVLADRTRVDCETLGYAIEADFADKWPEAVGQSVHYARMTGKLPGILLIIEHPRQCAKVASARQSLSRLQWHHGEYGMIKIRLWVVGDSLCQEKA